MLDLYFRGQLRIEFRSLSDLSQITQTYLTGSLKPGVLCTASTSTLLFTHWSNSCDLYFLDCSGVELKLTGKKISTGIYPVHDVCYVPDEKKPLLVAAGGWSTSSHAYNALSSELQWKNNVAANSVTTDGHNYLVTCAHFGNVINVLSLSDGKDLGCLVKEGDHGLGKPYWVQWSKTSSSLFVANVVDQKIDISTIRLD